MKLRASLAFAGCALWLAVLGWVDYATGYELGLFAFYTAPVALVAWHLGQGPGFIVAFISSVIWYLADRYAGEHYSAPFYGYWNTGMHFTTFIINAVTFAKIKSTLNQRRDLELDLKATRERLEKLHGLMELCPHCHKLCVPDTWRPDAEVLRVAAPIEAPPAACGARILYASVTNRAREWSE